MFFSLIIPMYNVEKTIENCLQSILQQSFEDFEVICVDDGSSDNTKDVVNRICKKDSRVRLVELVENSGAAIARKRGFQKSAGRYIWYIDADDSLASMVVLKKLHEIINREKTDILHFGTQLEITNDLSETEQQELSRILCPYDGRLTGNKLFRKSLVEEKIAYTLWNKICPRELWEKVYAYIPDVRINMSDDLTVMFIMFCLAQSYFGTEEVTGYKYVFGEGVSSMTNMNVKKFENYCLQTNVFSVLREFCEKQENADQLLELVEKKKQKIVEACVYIWFNQFSGEDSSVAFSMLSKYWGFDTVFEEVCNKYWYNWHSIVRKIPDFRFDFPKKKVRAIAVYYHRICNGGVEKVLSLLIPMWKKLGYKVVLVTDETESPDDYYLPEDVERVVIQHFASTDGHNYKNRHFQWKKLIKKYDVDLVMFNAWNNPILFWDMNVIKSMGVHFVVHAHSVFYCPVEWMGEGFYTLRDSIRRADGMVSLGEVDTAFWKMYNENSVRIHNPIEERFINHEPTHVKEPVVIWVARFDQGKRPEDVFDIMSRVVKKVPDAKLIMLGKTETEEEMKHYYEIREKYELEDVVEFAGFHKNVEPYYRSAKVHLSTSASEGYSMVLLESKSFGMPTVMYNLKNLDMVREGRGVLSCEIGDTASAANHLITLLSDNRKWEAEAKDALDSFHDMAGENLEQQWKDFFTGLSTAADNDCMENSYVTEIEPIRVASELLADAAMRRSAGAAMDAASMEDLRKAQKVCGQVINSMSFKIGRAITWLPRFLRNVIKGKPEE